MYSMPTHKGSEGGRLMNNGMTRVNRREMLRCAALGTAAGFLGLDVLASPTSALTAKKGTINFADIGVGDPGGDWTKFSAAAGWGGELVGGRETPPAGNTTLVGERRGAGGSGVEYRGG